MGVLLAQTKNGIEQFWNIEISCSQWEGSACTQSALFFFLFSLGVGFGGEGGFFSFFLLSPLCSLQVSNGFPSIFIVFLKVFPVAPRFNPICFAQSRPLLTHIGGPIEEGSAPSFHRIFHVGGASIVSRFGKSNWLIAKKTKKKVGLVRHPN
jgi:hypothetical protein